LRGLGDERGNKQDQDADAARADHGFVQPASHNIFGVSPMSKLLHRWLPWVLHD
jgi:hypothetical protein